MDTFISTSFPLEKVCTQHRLLRLRLCTLDWLRKVKTRGRWVRGRHNELLELVSWEWIVFRLVFLGLFFFFTFSSLVLFHLPFSSQIKGRGRVKTRQRKTRESRLHVRYIIIFLRSRTGCLTSLYLHVSCLFPQALSNRLFFSLFISTELLVITLTCFFSKLFPVE